MPQWCWCINRLWRSAQSRNGARAGGGGAAARSANKYRQQLVAYLAPEFPRTRVSWSGITRGRYCSGPMVCLGLGFFAVTILGAGDGRRLCRSVSALSPPQRRPSASSR